MPKTCSTNKLRDPRVLIVINGCGRDRVAADSRRESSHGRASQRPFWQKTVRERGVSPNLKGVKAQRGQKSKSGLVFSLPLLWSLRKARCDSLNSASEKRLGFHRPADPLRAGVSRIQFHSFSLPFPVHFPADDTADRAKSLSGVQ